MIFDLLCFAFMNVAIFIFVDALGKTLFVKDLLCIALDFTIFFDVLAIHKKESSSHFLVAKLLYKSKCPSACPSVSHEVGET